MNPAVAGKKSIRVEIIVSGAPPTGFWKQVFLPEESPSEQRRRVDRATNRCPARSWDTEHTKWLPGERPTEGISPNPLHESAAEARSRPARGAFV